MFCRFLLLGHVLCISLQSVAYPMGSTISIISIFLPKCCVPYGFCVLFEMLFMIFLHQVDTQFHPIPLSSSLLFAWSALPGHIFTLFARFYPAQKMETPPKKRRLEIATPPKEQAVLFFNYTPNCWVCLIKLILLKCMWKICIKAICLSSSNISR